MKQFQRIEVRLYADLNRTDRYFYRPELLSTWGQEVEEALLTGDELTFCAHDRGVVHRLESHEREKKLVFQRPEDGAHLEIHLMPCTSQTTYCTHVQLLLRREMTLEEAETEGRYYAALLEKLRRTINGDWIITEADLSLGMLRGSR